MQTLPEREEMYKMLPRKYMLSKKILLDYQALVSVLRFLFSKIKVRPQVYILSPLINYEIWILLANALPTLSINTLSICKPSETAGPWQPWTGGWTVLPTDGRLHCGWKVTCHVISGACVVRERYVLGCLPQRGRWLSLSYKPYFLDPETTPHKQNFSFPRFGGGRCI